MIKQFLQIAGVRNEKEFLAKYPTEASFFKAHPEARQLMNQSSGFTPNYADTMPQAMYGMGMAFGGYVPQAANGMQVSPPSDPPRQEDFPDYGSYAAAFDQWLATMQQQADVGEAVPQGDMNTTPMTTAPMNMSGAPVSAPSPYVPTNKVNLKDYKGMSVVDFLTAQGVPADFSSRKELASALGISNYRGTATQNKQMMQMIQQAPDILSDYQGIGQPTGNVRKAAARSKNANAAPTTQELAAAKYEADMPYINTAAEEINPYDPIASMGKRIPGYGDAYRLGMSPADQSYMYQAQLHRNDSDSGPAGKAYRDVYNRNYNNFEQTGNVQGHNPNSNHPYHNQIRRNLQTGLWVPNFDPEEPMMSADNAARAKLAQDMNAREAQGKSGAMFSQGRGMARGGSYTGTWNGNQGFAVGGAYLPDYAGSAYGLPQFELGAPIYAEGGMSPEEAMMMQQQQQGAAAPQGMMPPQDGGAQGGQFDQQQVIQAIFQMIQQGMPPEQIMQQLVQGGVPEQMAQELIQMVMQQMQAGGGQEGMGEQPNGAQQPQAPAGPEQGMQGMPMPGGMARGGMTPGWEGEVTMQQLEELRKKGVKFDII